jgi:uncharacterized protein (TIGR02246 family)
MTSRLGRGIFWCCISLVTLLVISRVSWVWRQAPQPALAAPQLKTLVQKARTAWLTGDADAWAALFVPEGEMIVPGQRWVGRAAIRKAAADFAASSQVVSIEIRRIVQQGNQALVEWYWQDREKGTNHLNRADDAIVIDLQADKIVRWREYIDAQTPVQSPTKP